MPFMRYGRMPEEMVRMFERMVARGLEREGPFIVDVTVHAHIFGRPAGDWVFERIAGLAASNRDLWTGTRLELARHFANTVR